MYDEIEQRFQRNIERVTNLIEVYEKTKGEGQGRRSVKTTDVLRAGVVFLHAGLEDALRALIKERLPNAETEVLNDVPLAGTGKGGRPEKFFLGVLIQHKGKSINQLIKESINEYYGQISFNDSKEIVSRLRRVKINYEDEGLGYLAKLDKMISRRHRIVHEADRNPNRGQGEYHALGINPGELSTWIDNVKLLVAKVIELARS